MIHVFDMTDEWRNYRLEFDAEVYLDANVHNGWKLCRLTLSRVGINSETPQIMHMT